MGKDNNNGGTGADPKESLWQIPTITAIFIVVFVLIIIAAVYFICVAKIPVKVSDQGLVITFLGVIATFVVVGNFMQTAEIKRETTERLHEYQRQFNTMNQKVKEDIEADIDKKVKELNDTITTTNEKTEEKIKLLETKIMSTRENLENHFKEELQKEEANFRNTIDNSIAANNQTQQTYIDNTKGEIETFLAGLINTQVYTSGDVTRNILKYVSLIIMLSPTQKKLLQDFLKHLPAYEIRYKKIGRTFVQLRDNGFGFIRLYDLKVRKFLDEGDYRKLESISSVRISDKGKIEEVLDIYSLYNQILTLIMQPSKTSGVKNDVEGSFADHKQEQGDNNDNEGNFQE